jgi:hypothetical protein
MQILRRIGGAKATPTSGSAGQIALWKAGTAKTDAASLFVHDGVQWNEMLDTSAQWTAKGADVYRAAGKVGIGVAAPLYSLDVFNATAAFINIGSSAATGVLGANSSNDAVGVIYRGAKSRGSAVAPTAAAANDDMIVIDAYAHDGSKYHYSGKMQISVDGAVAANSIPSRIEWHTTQAGQTGAVERMRIDNTGCLYIGRNTKAPNTPGSFINADGQFEFCLGQPSVINRIGSDGPVMIFQRQGVGVGGVVVSPSTTTYTTSSDYRLKENVSAMPDASSRVMSLKPCRFNFKAEPGKVVDGFIAHEVQAVVPEAVTGSKDAVDADGNPDYQGIDQSKLAPLLTAALQDALKRIAALEARQLKQSMMPSSTQLLKMHY